MPSSDVSPDLMPHFVGHTFMMFSEPRSQQGVVPQTGLKYLPTGLQVVHRIKRRDL